jgi:hypothetical protein
VRVSGEFGYVALSPPTGAANLIDVGVDGNSPDVGGLGTGSPAPRPGDVEPGQGRLDRGFGEMSVPAVSKQAERTSPMRLVWTNAENSSSRDDRGMHTSSPSIRVRTPAGLPATSDRR